MEIMSIPAVHVVVMLILNVVLSKSEAEHVGKWSAWTNWSGCSLSCGSGITTRTRVWEQPPGEKKFEKPFTFSENSGCNEGSCPEDGTWSVWGRWSHCTEACGGGITLRQRVCSAPRNGGNECEGEDFEEEECNRLPCPPPPARFNLSICTLDKHFMCTSRRMCIPKDDFCDNNVQCDDGSDEKSCSDNTWGSGKYSNVKDKGSSIAVSISGITGLVIMAVIILIVS